MSSKTANYIALLFLFILGIFYWVSARTISGSGIITNTLGPGFYPGLLAITLAILCIISFIQTLLKKEDERVDFPNLKLLLLTILIIGIFFVSWYFLGYFYIQLFVFLLILLTAYRFKERTKVIFITNSAISVVFAVTIFIIFDLVLNINF